MAPFYISSQSKKVQPNMSLDERLNVCARALLSNLLKVKTDGIFYYYPVPLSNDFLVSFLSKRLT